MAGGWLKGEAAVEVAACEDAQLDVLVGQTEPVDVSRCAADGEGAVVLQARRVPRRVSYLDTRYFPRAGGSSAP